MPVPLDLEIRPPRQERTHAAWNRVLEAGVAILEDAGYEGFTISAICERAGVSPPTIYARVRTKKALFFAVFDRGFEPIEKRQRDALSAGEWLEGKPDDIVRGIVEAIAIPTLDHERFLRAVIRRAEADPEVARRTHSARSGTADRFREVVLRHSHTLRPGADLDACFRVIFAALVARVVTPSSLDTGGSVSDVEFVAALQEIAVRVLLAD